MDALELERTDLFFCVCAPADSYKNCNQSAPAAVGVSDGRGIVSAERSDWATSGLRAGQQWDAAGII